MAKVTVVVPVFNEAATINRAIASVLNQTLADFELLVVDDASTDGTSAALAAVQDRRLRVIRHVRTGGVAKARNTGIGEATGEMIAFLDADDEWLPEKLARQIAAMTARPELAATCTAYYLAHGDKRILRGFGAGLNWRRELLDGCFIGPGSTLVARKACFSAVGLIDERLTRLEDWEWLIRLVDDRNFDCLSEPLAVVYAGGSPSSDVVIAAGKTLFALASGRVRTIFGEKGLSRLGATLQIESAVAAVREGKALLAAALLLRAGLLSPSRLAVFGKRMVKKILSRDW